MSEQKKTPRDSVVEALRKSPGSTVEELAGQVGIGLSTARKILVELEQEGKATRTSGGREGGKKLPDTWTHAISPKATEAGASNEPDEEPTKSQPAAPDGREVASTAKPGTATEKADRLPKGQLANLILGQLRAHPAEAQSPSSVGKAIGHSAGAISNALKKMAEKGEVTEVSEKPKRYSIKA